MASEFYDYPDLYDALLPAGGHALYYSRLAQQHTGPVLELACGTGLLTIPLSSGGGPVVGLDRSRAMLNAARRRASDAGAPVHLLQSDMRNFSLRRDFALIIVARNSLLHLHSTEDLIAAFTTARRHLAPDGVFAFDIFNPSVRLLSRASGQRAPVMEVNTAAFGPVTVEDTCDYDSATQVNHAVWYISTSEQRDAWTVPLALRSIFPQELPLLLSAAGLELTHRFGDLSKTPFDGSSRMQVCLCRRGT